MANIRIYTGDAVGQNELSEDWFRRRLASEAEGCGFDPRLAHHLAIQVFLKAFNGIGVSVMFRVFNRISNVA